MLTLRDGAIEPLRQKCAYGARGMQCMATHLAGVHVLLTQGVRAVLRKVNSEIIQKTNFWKLQMGPRVLIAAEEAAKCQKGLS